MDYAFSHNLDLPKGGIQLAYNEFYEADVKAWRLPIKFNAKPYHRHAPRTLNDTAIVHLQGPKPLDYMRWHATQDCGDWGNLCANGVMGRACLYVSDWLEHVDEADRAPYQEAWHHACSTWSYQTY